MLFRFLPLAFVSLLLASCESETEKNQSALIGRWQLTKGLRNKNETPTLQGVYYQFGADGKMQTNLPIGAEVPTDYTVEKDKIQQQGNPVVQYSILSLTDSTLTMTFEMHGVPFEFHFRRTSADAPLPSETPQSDSIPR